jgi:type I restriction enzyme R subunit
MLKETIREYELHRITESDYLSRVQNIMDNVLSHKDESFPEEVCRSDVTKAIYGIMKEFIAAKNLSADDTLKASIFVSLQADDICENSKIVDWQSNPDIVKKMKIQIFDMIYDGLKSGYDMDVSIPEIDSLTEKCI